jgi:hypothetical protein
MARTTTGKVRFGEGNQPSSDAARRAIPGFLIQEVAPTAQKQDNRAHGHQHPENVGLIK